MDDLPSRKRALRLRIKADVMAMDPATRLAEEAALVERVPQLPGFLEARTVLLFAAAFPEEYATGPIVSLSLALNKRLVFPRVDRREDRLRLLVVDDPATDFVGGMLGIPEPRRGLREVEPGQIDWALVPGLAFDARGYRLGRGKGHYDRLLPALREGVPRWALALSPQWVEVLPIEPHDAPLDGVAGAYREVERPGKTGAKFRDYG